MAVSGGYPGHYVKDKQINIPANLIQNEESILFHAGTRRENEILLTNGGRVLAATSFGNNIEEAVEKSKKILEAISFEGMYFRRDIGYEFPC